ncbi:hypothetical protein LCGC14_0405700 [marine sediment metagenome]|uniref:DNA methylase N-4/N-6 domain-containing protein n=1 Tax=marine sediment metagenome TaxID=412755 RepID=A0A0F9VHL2_9ZZZZ|nr:DNA modification methylase [archaeon]
MPEIIWKTEKRKISDLVEFKNNPRKLSEKQAEDLKKSLKKFGLAEIPAINTNNTILAGHQRIKILSQLKGPQYEIDVRIPSRELTDKESEEYVIRSNQNTGEWDRDILKDMFDMEDLCDWGFDEDDLTILDEEFEGTEGDDDVGEAPEEPVTKIGDMYHLGEHKLLCGDSAFIDDVQKVMEGQLADMLFTDPPYGVSYEGAAYDGKRKKRSKIESDDLNEEDLKNKVKEWFYNASTVLRGGAYTLSTVPAGPLHLIFTEVFKELGWLRQVLIWNKQAMVIGRSEYHYKHEPILFGWVPGKRLNCPDRTKTSVWDFNRPTRSDLHPTMKPVEMWMYGIKNHTKKGDLLYEPFVGSGTTLIACEKMGRKCFGLEIDPRYCDVIVKRYVDFCKKNKKEHSVMRNGEICNFFD